MKSEELEYTCKVLSMSCVTEMHWSFCLKIWSKVWRPFLCSTSLNSQESMQDRKIGKDLEPTDMYVLWNSMSLNACFETWKVSRGWLPFLLLSFTMVFFCVTLGCNWEKWSGKIDDFSNFLKIIFSEFPKQFILLDCVHIYLCAQILVLIYSIQHGQSLLMEINQL